MNKGSNAFRLFWAAMLATGLFISSGVYPSVAQDEVEESQASPSAQPSTPPAEAASPGGPPPLPATPSRNAPPPLPTFYIAEGGEPVGPLNMGELQQKVAGGTLTSSTLVWRDGMETWSPAQEVQELSSLFAAAGSAPAGQDVVEETAEFDAHSFLLGTWHTNGPVPLEGIGMSPADMTANYRQDNSVTLEGVVTANLGMPSPTPITLRSTGTWTVENVNENRFVLSATLTTTGSAPGVDLSGMEETDTSTGLVEVLGPDSVRDSEGVTWSRVR